MILHESVIFAIIHTDNSGNYHNNNEPSEQARTQDFPKGGCLKISLHHSARLEKKLIGGGGGCHFFSPMDIGIGRTILHLNLQYYKQKYIYIYI